MDFSEEKKKKDSESSLEIDENIKLIFAKANELCHLLTTIPLDMSLEIGADGFCVKQRYDKGTSFTDESNNGDDRSKQ